MIRYLACGAVAAIVAYFLTPAVRAYVIKVGAYDVPKDRKVHHAPTPTFGGVAIYIGAVSAFLAAALFPSLRSTFKFSEVFGLLAGGFVMLALGVVDDRHELSPPAKFAGQIFAAGILYLSGVQMSFFWIPGVGVISLSADLSALLTILWIIFVANAVNYIDGLDGLAAGLSAISALALFVYSTQLPAEFLGPDPLAPLVTAAVAGACIGFLPHNFNPARIFMGDSGAMPLGYLLAGATISVIGRFNGPGAAGGRLALPLVFTPILLLALPITDAFQVTLRRLATGRGIFTPDKEHIHYRMLRLGHSHRQAVLVMYGWATLLAGGLIVSGVLPWGRFLLAFAAGIGTVLLVTLAPRLRHGPPGALADRLREPV